MITESLGEVIEMPGVCPGGVHKTNEAELCEHGHTSVFMFS